MKTIKFIAACALYISAGASFGHENMPHHASDAPVAKEQKDWGIAGDAKAVGRTITLRMGDDMRFAPSHMEVQEGDTVRLRAENKRTRARCYTKLCWAPRPNSTSTRR